MNPRWYVYIRVRQYVRSIVERQVGWQVHDQLCYIYEQAWDQVHDHITWQLVDQVWEDRLSTWWPVYRQTRAQVDTQVRDQVDGHTRWRVMEQVDRVHWYIADQVAGHVYQQVREDL